MKQNCSSNVVLLFNIYTFLPGGFIKKEATQSMHVAKIWQSLWLLHIYEIVEKTPQ
jgi:hypothetical protein